MPPAWRCRARWWSCSTSSVRRDRLRIDPERSKVILLEGGDRLLPGFEEKASRYALQTLRLARGGRAARDSGGRGDREGGPSRQRRVDHAAVVIWAGGVTVDGTLAASLPPTHGRGGRVTLEPDLSVAGHPEVFVVGDAGAVPWGRARPEACPQVAQVAIQSGRHAALQIAPATGGTAHHAFQYHDKGLMATIGRHAAVAQLRGGLDSARDPRMAGVARPSPRLPGGIPQPGGGARQLVVAVPGLAVGAPAHRRRRRRRHLTPASAERTSADAGATVGRGKTGGGGAERHRPRHREPRAHRPRGDQALRPGGRRRGRCHPLPARRGPRGGPGPGRERRDDRRPLPRGRAAGPEPAGPSAPPAPTSCATWWPCCACCPSSSAVATWPSTCRAAPCAASASSCRPGPAGLVEQMGEVACEMWRATADAYADRAPVADEVEELDDELDELHVTLTAEIASGSMALPGGHRGRPGGPFLRALRRPRRQPGPPHRRHGGPGHDRGDRAAAPGRPSG